MPLGAEHGISVASCPPYRYLPIACPLPERSHEGAAEGMSVNIEGTVVVGEVAGAAVVKSWNSQPCLQASSKGCGNMDWHVALQSD